MVAVQSANRAPDATLASELGSLLLAHARIRDARWRLDAIVRRVPALVRFGVSLDSTRAAIRELGARASCPSPLRKLLVELLERHLDVAFVGALWSRDWASCAQTAVDATVRLSDEDGTRQVCAIMARSPRARYAMPVVSRRSTLADVIALVEDGRAEDAGRAANGLHAREQQYARAHLMRLAVRAAPIQAVSRVAFRPSPFRDASIRAGTRLLVVRELVARGCFAEARAVADEIQTTLIRQLAYIEMARGFVMPDASVEVARGLSIPDRHVSAQRGLAMSASFASPHGIASPVASVAIASVDTPCGLATSDRNATRRPIVDALRLLAAVTRPELAAERDYMRAEIRLMVRRDRESYDGVIKIPAWEIPAWLRPRRWLAGEHRRHRFLAVAFIRMALRDGLASTVDLARDEARRISPTALLELLPRIGVDVDEAIALLERPTGRIARFAPALDELRAARIAMRAAALVRSTRELPEPMRLGLAGLATFDNADGRSLERAWFDEGLALSSMASRRRRVLIGVAQSALRNARSQQPEVLDVRLRTLVHLGGTLGADALAKPLAQLPVDAAWQAALEALCVLDAARAGDIVVARLADLRRAKIDPSLALDHVVAHGGMTRERATGLVGTMRMLSTALGERAGQWLAEFTRRWHARTSSPLDEGALAWLRTCDLARDPQALLDELDEHRASILAADAREIADRLATDARLLRGLLLDVPRVDRRMPVWTLERWKSLLARAATRSLVVDTALVRRHARALGDARRAHALVAGDLAAFGIPPITDVHLLGQRFAIRVLDKRRDLLTYLRFADTPVRSCFRSDSWLYRASDIVLAWRDPLTICIHVERAGEPCGFLFGSFAEVGGAPALVFNSLHVRPNTPAVREAILRAIERGICAPLRIRVLGIANWYNGEGYLPADYVRGERRGTRFCGVSIDGALVTPVDDDISVDVNTDQPLDLYWRDLERDK